MAVDRSSTVRNGVGVSRCITGVQQDEEVKNRDRDPDKIQEDKFLVHQRYDYTVTVFGAHVVTVHTKKG